MLHCSKMFGEGKEIINSTNCRRTNTNNVIEKIKFTVILGKLRVEVAQTARRLT